MGKYDIENFEIKNKLPMWWKDDLFLDIMETYSSKEVTKWLDRILSSVSLEQPVQVWKHLPEEFNWISTDAYEYDFPHKGNSSTIKVPLPTTKRPTHAKIRIELKSDDQFKPLIIPELKIKNDQQEIIIHNIYDNSTIDIDTKNNITLINNEYEPDQITGSIKWILPEPIQPINSDFTQPYENKKNELTISTPGSNIKYNLRVELLNPVFVTEQRIQLKSVSQFPIKKLELYGYYCHQFNTAFNGRWALLETKEYDENIVFDSLAYQYDVEIFFVKVWFAGMESPISVGFPQSTDATNKIFLPNPTLDRWGKTLSLPRKIFLDFILPEEERECEPPYYDYNIEQDITYQKRMLSEYAWNEDEIDNIFIKDSTGRSIATAECIWPYTDDIWIHTESRIPKEESAHQLITYPTSVIDKEGWDNLQNIKRKDASMATTTLQKKSYNDFNNIADIITCKFDFPKLQNDIKITGLEFKITAFADKLLNVLVDDRSSLNLAYILPDQTIIDTIPVNNIELGLYPDSQNTYSIGGKDYLFNLGEIKTEQLKEGLTLNLALTNTHLNLQTQISIYDIACIIHYQQLEEIFKLKLQLDKKILFNEETLTTKITIINNGQTPLENKQIHIFLPSELEIQTNNDNKSFYEFIIEYLEIGEEWEIEIPIIALENGVFDITLVCDNQVQQETIKVVK